MTRRDDDLSDRPDARAIVALHRIAEALGSPVETFLQQPQSLNEISSTEELLRLWGDLPDAQARRRILSQLRFELERDRQQPDAAE